MPRTRYWTDEEMDAIVKQYSEGVRRIQIAKQFGTKFEKITAILKSRGVEVHPFNRNKLTPEQEADMVRRYLDRERTILKVCKLRKCRNDNRSLFNRFICRPV